MSTVNNEFCTCIILSFGRLLYFIVPISIGCFSRALNDASLLLGGRRYISAQYGHVDVVKLLVDRGANVNMKCMGATALQVAIEKNKEGVVRVLLDNGAESTVTDDRSPLHLACKLGHVKIVEMLLDCAVDINLQIPELQNATPLMTAFQNGHTAVTESLVGRGARVDIADSSGISPILMVCNKGILHQLEMMLKNATGLMFIHSAKLKFEPVTAGQCAEFAAIVNKLMWFAVGRVDLFTSDQEPVDADNDDDDDEVDITTTALQRCGFSIGPASKRDLKRLDDLQRQLDDQLEALTKELESKREAEVVLQAVEKKKEGERLKRLKKRDKKDRAKKDSHFIDLRDSFFFAVEHFGNGSSEHCKLTEIIEHASECFAWYAGEAEFTKLLAEWVEQEYLESPKADTYLVTEKGKKIKKG